jgi:hypothetical protein
MRSFGRDEGFFVDVSQVSPGDHYAIDMIRSDAELVATNANTIGEFAISAYRTDAMNSSAPALRALSDVRARLSAVPGFVIEDVGNDEGAE